jgi:hypothetical protein
MALYRHTLTGELLDDDVHFIHARKSSESRLAIDVEVTVGDDGSVEIAGKDLAIVDMGRPVGGERRLARRRPAHDGDAAAGGRRQRATSSRR